MYTLTKQTLRLQALGILPSEPLREKELNRFGVMIWDHKTGGSCQVLSGSSFKNAKQYMALPGHRSGIKKYRG